MVRTPKAAAGKEAGAEKPMTTAETMTALEHLRRQFEQEHATQPPSPAKAQSVSPPAAAAPPPGHVEYKLVHRGEFDMSEFLDSRDAVPPSRPKELVLTLSLPACSRFRSKARRKKAKKMEKKRRRKTREEKRRQEK